MMNVWNFLAESTDAAEKKPMWDIADKGDFGNVALLSLFCVVVVFLILILITLLLSGMNRIHALDVKETVRMQDGTELDDDAMAAVLVATLDYRKEYKEDVRVVSCTLIEDEKKDKKHHK